MSQGHFALKSIKASKNDICLSQQNKLKVK